ncbi:MAG TPA: hypothetical protein VE176_01615, partial [Candidatus Limnocylindrales bacterium]|nr:hypothetical protein [Candidatus Limnocylindrales bacterium]
EVAAHRQLVENVNLLARGFFTGSTFDHGPGYIGLSCWQKCKRNPKIGKRYFSHHGGPGQKTLYLGTFPELTGNRIPASADVNKVFHDGVLE